MSFSHWIARRTHQEWRARWALLTVFVLIAALLGAQPLAAAPLHQTGEPITTLDEVEKGVIQIEAEGVFVDPPKARWSAAATGRASSSTPRASP